MATRTHKATKIESPTADAKSHYKWWQWILVYPTLAVALTGALPTAKDLFNSFRLDVPLKDVGDAQKQHDAFVRNLSCLESPEVSFSKRIFDTDISSKVCDSGDIFLQASRPSWKLPQTRWVTWSEIAPESQRASLFGFTFPSLIAEATAATNNGVQLAQNGPIGQTRVVCQRWTGNGLLLQRLQAQNGCFNQVINTYSGWITSIHKVPCNTPCQA